MGIMEVSSMVDDSINPYNPNCHTLSFLEFQLSQSLDKIKNFELIFFIDALL